MNPNDTNQTAPIEPTPEVIAPTAPATDPATPVAKKRRGFAAMDPAKVKEIAGKGGRSAHAAGTAHRFSSDEARAAGQKGGNAPHVRRGRGAVKGEAQ